jgi:hypothetical protein
LLQIYGNAFGKKVIRMKKIMDLNWEIITLAANSKPII